ncbi:tripartite tricarboxylate transporter substrate binding protein [Paucibacter sp. O1-1]|nr:tripartite tricarboxylate transporter substrate binding protein [Paucibacter sp. O1-1]MDA3825048.1 tripartite tricarboxylate transporter substrate binding protein [Paucibacter sp. O1-1]
MNKPKRRRILAWAIAITTLITTPSMAQSHRSDNSYPSRPVTLIVPYGAGGSTDVIGRAIAESLSRQLGQPVVVENKPGAAGAMGVLDMLSAKPDGYRLTMSPAGIFRQPHLQPTRYDPIKDLTYIASFLTFDFAVAVRAESPIKTVDDLVKFAKADPDGVSYGTSGLHTGNHVVGAALAKDQGIKMTHIPYKGDSDNIAALLGQQINMAITTNTVLNHVKAGTVRVLAISGSERNPTFEGVPTLRELGYGVAVSTPMGISGPAGLPRPIVEALDAAIKAALEDPKVKSQYGNLGIRPLYMNNQAYSDFARKTFADEKELVKILN